MARRRRSHRRRRVSRRRRHNPGIGGIPLPNFQDTLVAVAGGLGAKSFGQMIARDFIAKDASGFLSPAITFGSAIALGFILKMVKMGGFARAVVTGGTIVAGIDVVKKLVPQLGISGFYTAPGDDVPVLGAGNGIGMFPAGFQDPSLAQGGDYSGGFDMSDDFLSE